MNKRTNNNRVNANAKRNERTKRRRQKLHKDRLEKSKMDKLYTESKRIKNTVDGQINQSFEDSSNPHTSKKPESPTTRSYFLQALTEVYVYMPKLW